MKKSNLEMERSLPHIQKEINSNIPIDQQMSLEEYKACVLECLLQIPPNTIQVAKKLMKEYENDFLYEYKNNSNPRMVATQIAYNLL